MKKDITKNISSVFLTYGCFAVICQSIFILLHMSYFNASAPPNVLFNTYWYALEYPLVSAALLSASAYVIELVIKKG